MGNNDIKYVKLKDSHNTIIVINGKDNSEESAKKYVRDLQEYKYRTEKYLKKENIMAKIK